MCRETRLLLHGSGDCLASNPLPKLSINIEEHIFRMTNRLEVGKRKYHKFLLLPKIEQAHTHSSGENQVPEWNTHF